MSLLQNLYIPIYINKCKILSLLCWLRGKSELLILNKKVKVVNSFVKNMIFNNCESKLVVFMRFFLSMSL